MFLKSLILISILFGLSSITKAQFTSASSESLGNSSLSHDDPLAMNKNIANLCMIRSLNLSASAKNLYAIDDAYFINSCLIIPFRRSAIASFFSIQSMVNLYRFRSSLAYGLPIKDHIFIGCAINYEWTTEVNEGEVILFADLNSNFQITKNLFISLGVFGLKQEILNEDLRIKLGLLHSINPQLLIHFNLAVQLIYGTHASLGIEYKVSSKFSLRSSIESLSYSFAIGMGFQFFKMRFDLCLQYHPLLGISPSTSLYPHVGPN